MFHSKLPSKSINLLRLLIHTFSPYFSFNHLYTRENICVNKKRTFVLFSRVNIKLFFVRYAFAHMACKQYMRRLFVQNLDERLFFLLKT